MSFPQSNSFNMTLETRIQRLSEDKCRAMMLDVGDQEAWREAIRKQLEAELEARVREVLESQFGQRHSNRPNPRVDETSRVVGGLKLNPVETANGLAEITEKAKEFDKADDWRTGEVKRKIQEIMDESSKELLRPCYREQHSSLLLNHLGQNNRHRLTDFLLTLGRPKEPAVRTLQYYSEINEKALCDFSGLSISERHSFFYPFTKAGFQESVKTGMLPDGSVLMEVEPGLFRDHLGIIRTKHGPFWPVDSGPMLPTPVHKRSVQQVTEPLQNSFAVFHEFSSQSSDIELQEKHRRQPEGQLQHELQRQKQSSDHYHPQRHRSTDVKPDRLQVQQQSLRYPGKWRGVMVVFDSERTPKDSSPIALSDCHCPSLAFESRFESGNLRQARRVGQFEYELVLSTDLYTKRHTQWYYFQVQNALPNVTYTFKIINLLKRDSLYAYGMQPLFYSEHLSKAKDIGWLRSGHSISYTRNLNSLQCPLLSRERTYYALEWQMDFPSADDTCYLAHCYPYTFTDLRQDLSDLVCDPERSKFTKLDVLCQTKAGNSCFLVTVAENPLETMFGAGKQGIVVTARVHPGETNSSWIMRGLLLHITGSSESAKELRKNFVFKIVPMINPDGVIIGNYRCCLSGHDLNRNYRRPNREAFPVIWHIKEMITTLSSNVPVLLYCDVHGHSRKQNVFMYGCAADLDDQTDESPVAYLRHRLFPWLMARKCPDKFSYSGCKFQIRRCKESTGRVVMYRQLSIQNSYTMEATFCGTTICNGEGKHFNVIDFEEMGKVLCEVALEYRETQENASLESKVLREMMRFLVEQVVHQHLSSKKDRGFSGELKLTDERNALTEASTMNPVHQNNFSDSFNLSIFDSTSGDSLESCLEMSKGMSFTRQLKESDSSDSDSESEPEYVATKSRLHQRKRKKKVKGQKTEVKQVDEVITVTDLLSNQVFVADKTSLMSLDSGLPMIDSCELETKKKKLRRKKVGCPNPDQTVVHRRALRAYPQFVNKYEGRSNGGIPCFAEERILYRAAKRTVELQKKYYEELRMEDEEEEETEEEMNPNSLVDFRNGDRVHLLCICSRLLSMNSLNRASVLDESEPEGISRADRRRSRLCSRCGLHQKQNAFVSWLNPLNTDAASCFQHKFHSVTSDSQRCQSLFGLNFTSFDVTAAPTNGLKTNDGSMFSTNNAQREPDCTKQENQTCSSSNAALGKLSRTSFQTEKQQLHLVPSIFQLPINKLIKKY